MNIGQLREKLQSIDLDIVGTHCDGKETLYELTDGNLWSVKQLKTLVESI